MSNAINKILKLQNKSKKQFTTLEMFLVDALIELRDEQCQLESRINKLEWIQPVDPVTGEY
jgi:hypothetical protein